MHSHALCSTSLPVNVGACAVKDRQLGSRTHQLQLEAKTCCTDTNCTQNQLQGTLSTRVPTPTVVASVLGLALLLVAVLSASSLKSSVNIRPASMQAKAPESARHDGVSGSGDGSASVDSTTSLAGVSAAAADSLGASSYNFSLSRRDMSRALVSYGGEAARARRALAKLARREPIRVAFMGEALRMAGTAQALHSAKPPACALLHGNVSNARSGGRAQPCPWHVNVLTHFCNPAPPACPVVPGGASQSALAAASWAKRTTYRPCFGGYGRLSHTPTISW